LASTFGSSETDLMSQRPQRMSSSVIAAKPSAASGSWVGDRVIGVADMKTVGGTAGYGNG
jgi:hypothetical protein